MTGMDIVLAAPQSHSTLGGRLLRWLMRGLAFLLLVAYPVATWWLDRWSLGVEFGAYLAWQRVLANAAVGLLLGFLLAAVTRKLLASILVVYGLQAALYVASLLKLRLLEMPIVLQDAYFVAALDTSAWSLLSQYIDTNGYGISAGIGGLILLVSLFWFEPAWCKRFGPVRMLSLLLSATLLVSLLVSAWPWTSYWYQEHQVRPSPLSQSEATLHGGLVTSLVYYHGVQRHRLFPVDRLALQEARRKSAGMGGRNPLARVAGQPDIVVVLSESFMDPHVLRGMDTLPDLIPNVRRQLASGNGGMIKVPTFGGGTVRTEFQVLTGMPVSSFPTAYYPYVDLNPPVMPGLVSVLEKHGYASFAVHGNGGSFWNRTSTYKAMGIDRFITLRELLKTGGQLDGIWLSDESMTDVVLETLSGMDKPTIAIAISIQSHGPYGSDIEVHDPEVRDAIRVPQSLDPDAAKEFRQYLYHLHSADLQFQRLLEGLSARKRPFVLLFFGDHLPALGGKTYDQLGMVNGMGVKDQFVPFVLVAGDGSSIELQKIGPQVRRSWQLPAMVMEVSGVSDSYFDFIRDVAAILPPPGTGAIGDEHLVRGLDSAANARLFDRFDEYAEAK